MFAFSRGALVAAVAAVGVACSSTPSPDTAPTPATANAPAAGGADTARAATADATDPASTPGAVAPAPSAPPADVPPASAAAPAPASAAPTAAAAVEARIDSTIAAAEGGLTRLAPAVAIPIVSSFRDFLSSQGDPALQSIAADLDALRAELSKPTINPQVAGQLLNRLGTKATAAAPSAGPLGSRVARLGLDLSRAAGQLTAGQ